MSLLSKFSFLLLLATAGVAPAASAGLNPTEVAATLKRSADWQLANPSRIETTDWVIAPFYDGLIRLGLTTGDPTYLAAVVQLGQQSGWSPRWRVYHADDHAVGHAWLDLYALDKARTERLKPIKERIDYVMAHPITEALDFRKKAGAGLSVTDRWTWCDALFMAPPTFARLHALTGDPEYLAFMEREYRYTYDQLWDPEAGLFYRDGSFIGKLTPNGKRIFWSRGNGWVYAGIPLVLEHVPAQHPVRELLLHVYREMTRTIVAAQQADGLWRPSLADPDHIAIGETSGSAFFVFGLAWGVNQGILDRATYWPAIERGWKALLTRVRPDGYVGYVQPIGAAPQALTAESKEVYGTGGLLLAGSEILRALGAQAKVAPEAVLRQAEERLAAQSGKPRAYARLVPERKDDLAWENDQVAFRIYGPALRSGPEDSGIDVWCKRVARPILDAWYRADAEKGISYHQDHGEGYDAYKVGDTRGCGAPALWVDGRMVTSDTYKHADVRWTAPDVAEFVAYYDYPAVGGKRIHEIRMIKLRMGEQLFEVTSRFQQGPGWRASPHAGLDVAVGLVNQKSGATMQLEPKAGWMAVWEPFDRQHLGTGATFAPGSVVEMKRLPHDGQTAGHEHAVAVLRTDAKGEIRYRAGFGWDARHPAAATAKGWFEYVAAQVAR